MKTKIPNGKFSADDALKRKRKEIAEKLKKGNGNLTISKQGNVQTSDGENTGDNIHIPPGKLASFYWYENDPELLKNEIEVMQNFFPSFQLDKLDDNRLTWFGIIEPNIIGNTDWKIQLVYDNDHPSSGKWGGSVKAYFIEPTIEKLESEFRSELSQALPHILTDSSGNKYLCTSQKSDFVATKNKSTSAASCLTWAVKWISAYELYLSGELEYSDFNGHI